MKAKKLETSPSILGVWEYMLTDYEGMAIITENHFIHFLMPKNNSNLKSKLTNSDKIKLFDNMIIEAGTQTIDDSIVTCKILYDKNPLI